MNSWQDQYLDRISYCDCLEGMRNLPDECVDLVVTDPPYGMKFMNLDFDKAVPSVEIWKEMLRVMKPGTFAFIMCIPRQDCLARMIVNLQDAGFDTSFSFLVHAFASGFPKAANLSKMADRRNGRKQETYKPFAEYIKQKRLEKGLSKNDIDKILGTNTAYSWWEGRISGIQLPTKEYYLRLKKILDLDDHFDKLIEREEAEKEVIGSGKCGKTAFMGGIRQTETTDGSFDITLPATPEAKRLEGAYAGCQLKPAVEIILVAMRPLSEKTYLDQALANGKGCVWLDDVRIPWQGKEDMGDPHRFKTALSSEGSHEGWKREAHKNSKLPIVGKDGGRFPANLIVENSILDTGEITGAGITGSGVVTQKNRSGEYLPHNVYGERKIIKQDFPYLDQGGFSRFFSLDAWWSERIKRLPESVQKTFPFMIVPKAPQNQKWFWCRICKIARPVKEREDHKEHNTHCHDCGVDFSSDDKDRLHKGHRTETNIIMHPTQKNLALASYLVTMGSREGDVVLDLFMGTGWVPKACKLLNRRFIAFDNDSEFCEIAEARLKAWGENNQLELGI